MTLFCAVPYCLERHWIGELVTASELRADALAAGWSVIADATGCRDWFCIRHRRLAPTWLAPIWSIAGTLKTTTDSPTLGGST